MPGGALVGGIGAGTFMTRDVARQGGSPESRADDARYAIPLAIAAGSAAGMFGVFWCLAATSVGSYYGMRAYARYEEKQRLSLIHESDSQEHVASWKRDGRPMHEHHGIDSSADHGIDSSADHGIDSSADHSTYRSTYRNVDRRPHDFRDIIQEVAK